MRLLITGWQGQVARAFVEAAPARPDIVSCAVGRPALDICEIRTIERALGDTNPDVIINTAGYTAVDQAEDEPQRAFAMNRDGARLIAEAARRRGAPIIHLSTEYVFDGRKETPYVESDPTAPLNVYGHSKLAGEEEVRKANPKHLILRTSWVFSPFGANFVKSILERASAGKPLRVVSDQHGNPTYAPHLVDAILTLANLVKDLGDDSPLWGTYHAAGSGVASWYDLAADAIARAHGPAAEITPIATSDYPTRAARPMNSALDCDALSRTFGITLPHWRDGVAACISRLDEARIGASA